METISTAQDLENIGVGPTCEPVSIHLCWCHVGALQMCVICVWQSRLHSRSSTRERAMCVQHTERNCRSLRRSTARVRHGQNHAHEALSSLQVQYSRGKRLRLHLAHLLDHCASSASASTGCRWRPPLTKPCRSCKTGESTWRTQHCRT